MEQAAPQIDITDPDDIRAKFDDLEDVIETRRRELDRLESVADRLAVLAGVRRRKRSTKGGKASAPREPSAKDKAVALVIKTGGPVNVDFATERLKPLKRKTVGWALWKGAQEGLIQGLGGGVYAPLGIAAEEIALRLNGGTAETENET